MDEQLDIAEVASYIGRRYTALYRSRGAEFARCTFGTRWENTWKKAAALCLQNGFDPDMHVRALFAEHKPDPLPYQLLGEWAVERTRMFVATQHGNELVYAQSQLVHLENCLRIGDSMAEALLSPNTDLTDAFRYCIAVKAGLPAIASRFREHARLELQMNPERLEVLRRVLPGSFTEAIDDGIEPGAASTTRNPPSQRS